MRPLTLVAACAVLFGASTSAAQTPEQPSALPHSDSARERRLDVRVGTGAPMLFSLSVAARPLEQPLALDAGLWVFAFSQGSYLRAGWTFGLADYREGVKGATLELTPMIGVLAGIAGGDTVERFLVPEAVVSFDYTWWFSHGFGLGATATLGVVYTAAYADAIDVSAFPDARLAVGVSF